MAFTALTAAEVLAGEPTKTELFDKIRLNLDDHESRIGTLAASLASFPAITFEMNGPYWSRGAQDAILYERLTFGISLLAARLQIHQAGTSGTTEIDIKLKRGAGAWVSIFNTRPSVLFSAGDLSVSTNAVIDPTYVNLLAGDLLRLDLTGVQALGVGAKIYLEWEK